MKVKEHIKELKKGVFKIAIVLGLVFVGVLVASPTILTWLVNYYGVNLVTLNPLESINAQIFMTLIISIICIIPMATYGIIRFVKPAYNSKKATKWIVTAEALALFGFTIGITFMTKQMLGLLSIGSLFTNLWSVNQVLSFGMVIGFIFAGSSELIILIPALSKFGIRLDKIKNLRAILVVNLLIVAGILTPTGDMFSQMLVAVPMYCCFEIGMLLSKFNKKEVKIC